MTDPTQPTPTGAIPPPGVTTADVMRREVADLRQQIANLRAAQSAGRAWVFGTVALVVLLFAAFTLYTYRRIRHNFDQPAVQRAISAHGAEVLPMTQQMLAETGRNVMPAYRDAIVATLRARGPAAASAAVARFQKIPQQSGAAMQGKLQTAFDASVKRIEPDFRAAYPNVSDERRQQLLQAFAADQIDAQNKRVAARVDQLYTNDLERMQAVLEKYKVPTPAGPDGQAALERQFLHTMVALLDDQVDAAYAPPANETGGGGAAGQTPISAVPTTAPATP